jgi:hypothetical protein
MQNIDINVYHENGWVKLSLEDWNKIVEVVEIAAPVRQRFMGNGQATQQITAPDRLPHPRLEKRNDAAAGGG